jgi:hypothetical protein
MRIRESANLEIDMHRQVRKAYQQVSQYIYKKHEPDYDIELGKKGDFYVYSSRSMGVHGDFLLLIGLRRPNTIGMSGALMAFNEGIFDMHRGIAIYGMRELTMDDLYSTVNSTSFLEVFEHEYLHLLDIDRTNGRITAKNSPDTRTADYYNDPAEFNAFYHDLAKPMLDAIRNINDEPQYTKDILDLYNITGDYRHDIAGMMTANVHTRRFATSLTPERRRSLLRRLYGLYQQLLTVAHEQLD